MRIVWAWQFAGVEYVIDLRQWLLGANIIRCRSARSPIVDQTYWNVFIGPVRIGKAMMA